MDILLSHGYFLRDDATERKVMKPYPPLGLLYLAADLKRAGLEASVYDSTFGSQAGFLEHLVAGGAPVVGLYGNLLTRRPVLKLIQACRARGVKVVLGGPEPANYPTEYLARGADVVVVGEGERTLRELLPQLLRRGAPSLESIPGICYLAEDGSLVRTPPREHIQDLDGLPWPQRDAIDLERYQESWRRHHGYSTVSLITSRGCPYTCTWCSHGVFGFTYRHRSASGVADEVEFLQDRYDPDLLWYADDVFTLNRRWLFDFAAELERRRIRVPFETITREDRLDKEVIRCLAAMGCRRLWVGAESGSQRVLDAMQRRTDASRVPEVVRLLQAEGIQAGLFIMLGYDGERIDDLKSTLEFLKRVAPDTFLTTVAYPIKGTPYYAAVEDRLIQRVSWEMGTDRELEVAGQPNAGYYRFTQRWMTGELALHRGPTKPWSRVKAYLNARLGRLGMELSRLTSHFRR